MERKKTSLKNWHELIFSPILLPKEVLCSPVARVRVAYLVCICMAEHTIKPWNVKTRKRTMEEIWES